MNKKTVVASVGVAIFVGIVIVSVAVTKRNETASVAPARIHFCVHSGDGPDGSDEFKAGAIAYGDAQDSLQTIALRGTSVSVNASLTPGTFTISYLINNQPRDGSFTISRDKAVAEERLQEYFCRIDAQGEGHIGIKFVNGDIASGGWTIKILGQSIYSGAAPQGTNVKPGLTQQGKADYVTSSSPAGSSGAAY